MVDTAGDLIPNKELLRTSYLLQRLLRAPKKRVRRSSVNILGYISKAVGPQDIMNILLNNFSSQSRMERICSSVAVAIVSETCFPFHDATNSYT